MKSIIKYIGILIVIYLLGTIFRLVFLKEHKYEYKIDKYNIIEYLKNNRYHYEVTSGKEYYNFDIEKNYHNKYKILKKIEEVKESNIKCLVPIYKNNIVGSISCRINNKNVAYSYLKNKELSKNIIKKLSKYKIKELEKDNYKETKLQYNYPITIYKNNLFENKLLLWNYNGVINIGRKTILNKYLKEDIYENIGGIVENNYMTLTNKYIYLYDIKTNKINKIKNIVDMGNKVEVLNIEDGKAYIKNIDDRTYYIYNNKTKKIKSTYKYQFQTDKNINKKHKDVRLYKIGEYYYYTDNNIFYRSSIYNTKEETILFELENSSYKISNKGIILLKDNEAYIYTNEVGLRLIARSNEFRFHANNMIEIYK